MPNIVLASNNPGKVREFEQMANKLGWTLISQSTFNLESVEETGLTFIENAIIKARHATKHTGLPALADDSGLEVKALNGAPGIYSARFAGEQGDDQANNARLLELMKNVPEEKRQANFRCCLAFLRHENDPCPVIAEGIWKGRIAHDAKGNNGFGYDPLFIVEGVEMRSAELIPEEKNRLSHRALAIQTLTEKIRTLGIGND